MGLLKEDGAMEDERAMRDNHTGIECPFPPLSSSSSISASSS